VLVLSRKERERVRLGDSIVITVVRLSGDRVRLGIEAPDDLVVLREELETGQPTAGEASRRGVQPPYIHPAREAA